MNVIICFCKGTPAPLLTEKIMDYEKKYKEPKHATDSKSERVIKAARSVLNNWLDGTDCPDVSGDFAELEYAIREYDGEEKQKEQPKKSQKSCNDCPHCVDRKDQFGWHFKGCFGGPYHGKFIAEIDECPFQQEQPEVDLEKEIDRYCKPIQAWQIQEAPFTNLENCARHFYELGLNARKEEQK